MHRCKAWRGGMALDETIQPVDFGQTYPVQKPFHSVPLVPLVPWVPAVFDFSPQ
jgi:hypothetical protein